MARLASMDMLKGFAIIMVIAGHAVQYLISGHYYDKEVYRLIYSFHMPLFMAITGFFASGGGGICQAISKTRISFAFTIGGLCLHNEVHIPCFASFYRLFNLQFMVSQKRPMLHTSVCNNLCSAFSIEMDSHNTDSRIISVSIDF